MNSSDKIDALAKALIAAQREMRVANKSATNPHFKSKYAPLPEVIEVAKVLHTHGIVFVQPTFESDRGVGIETLVIHAESGQWISGALVLTPQQNTPQGIGSAITYGRRFGLASLIGIVAEEDDDGEAASAPTVQPKNRGGSRSPAGAHNPGAAGATPASATKPVFKAVRSDPYIFDPVATEKRMLLELIGGFDTWDLKRAWRERNQGDKNMLPAEAQLRVSAAYIDAHPVAKQSNSVAP